MFSQGFEIILTAFILILVFAFQCKSDQWLAATWLGSNQYLMSVVLASMGIFLWHCHQQLNGSFSHNYKMFLSFLVGVALPVAWVVFSWVAWILDTFEGQFPAYEVKCVEYYNIYSDATTNNSRIRGLIEFNEA